MASWTRCALSPASPCPGVLCLLLAQGFTPACLEQLWDKGRFWKENWSQRQTFPGVTQCGEELVQEALLGYSSVRVAGPGNCFYFCLKAESRQPPQRQREPMVSPVLQLTAVASTAISRYHLQNTLHILPKQVVTGQANCNKLVVLNTWFWILLPTNQRNVWYFQLQLYRPKTTILF